MLHKIQIAVLFLLIPVGALVLYARSENIPIREIFAPGAQIAIVGEIPVKVEIVDTPDARTKGLSGRAELTGVDGMLFVFDTTERHGIWMKDMKFPIDIIWIDESFKVVAVDRGVIPETYPKTFRPPVPVRYVIETNDNFTDTFGIGVGAMVRLPITVKSED